MVRLALATPAPLLKKKRTPHRILYYTSHDALDDNTQMSMVSCASASLCRSPPQPPAPPPRCLSCPSRFGAASPRLLPSPPSFRMETPLLHSPPKWAPFFTTCRPTLLLRRLGAFLQCRSASSHAGALARRRWLVESIPMNFNLLQSIAINCNQLTPEQPQPLNRLDPEFI